MKTILKYKSFFAYSESSNKYFYTSFSEGINLVYGRNTSGKSTLIQAILYTFGNNDLKTQFFGSDFLDVIDITNDDIDKWISEVI